MPGAMNRTRRKCVWLLRQPGLDLLFPGRPVLGQDRGPVPGHRHAAAAAGGRPRLEGRPADRQAQRHRPRRAEDRRHPPAAERQGRADTRAGALPGHRPVGHGGARTLCAVGGPEPGQRRRDQLGQGTPAPQGPDGPEDPRAAARPARPHPHRRRPQERDRPPAPGRHGDTARRDHRGTGGTLRRAVVPKANGRHVGPRTLPPASAATCPTRKKKRSGPSP